MKYIVSKQASADLENIWLYTFENWSFEQADRYIQVIPDEFSYLSTDPYSGKDRNEIREGYRSSKVKSHLIFYRVDNQAAQIEIVRILHESIPEYTQPRRVLPSASCIFAAQRKGARVV